MNQCNKCILHIVVVVCVTELYQMKKEQFFRYHANSMYFRNKITKTNDLNCKYLSLGFALNTATSDLRCIKTAGTNCKTQFDCFLNLFRNARDFNLLTTFIHF